MDLSIGDRVFYTRFNDLRPPDTVVGTAEGGLLHLEYYQDGLRVVNWQCKMESTSIYFFSNHSFFKMNWGFTQAELNTCLKVLEAICDDPALLVEPKISATGIEELINCAALSNSPPKAKQDFRLSGKAPILGSDLSPGKYGSSAMNGPASSSSKYSASGSANSAPKYGAAGGGGAYGSGGGGGAGYANSAPKYSGAGGGGRGAKYGSISSTTPAKYGSMNGTSAGPKYGSTANAFGSPAPPGGAKYGGSGGGGGTAKYGAMPAPASSYQRPRPFTPNPAVWSLRQHVWLPSQRPSKGRRVTRHPQLTVDRCTPLTDAWWKCLLNERGELEKLDDARVLVSRLWGLRFTGGAIVQDGAALEASRETRGHATLRSS